MNGKPKDDKTNAWIQKKNIEAPTENCLVDKIVGHKFTRGYLIVTPKQANDYIVWRVTIKQSMMTHGN